MEIIKSEYDTLRALRKKNQRIQTCMIKNQCMATESCPKKKKPVNCFRVLEAGRNLERIIYQSLTPSGEEAWTGEYSKKSTHNPRR